MDYTTPRIPSPCAAGRGPGPTAIELGWRCNARCDPLHHNPNRSLNLPRDFGVRVRLRLRLRTPRNALIQWQCTPALSLGSWSLPTSFAAEHRGHFVSTRKTAALLSQGRLRPKPKPHLSAVPRDFSARRDVSRR